MELKTEMIFEQVIKPLNRNPRKLFLIDAFGALLSAFLLGVVLVRLERTFGIPPSTLYILASLPVFFAIYDWFCFQKKSENMGVFLRGIAIMNLAYCCLSIGFVFYHHHEITHFGWIYILLEVLIVSVLATVELTVAKRLIRASN